ncbi:Protein-tyrosine sulfotransferase [Nymphaea thermarum]|nr:Protein-tyrosine sulfotransferase [Nymphaea thermarum]
MKAENPNAENVPELKEQIDVNGAATLVSGDAPASMRPVPTKRNGVSKAWLRTARDARRNQSMMSEERDPYNINQIALPLHDFVNDPLVHELVHNAVTLQVAGLTETSCLQESHAIRHCIRMHHSLGNYVLDVAKIRPQLHRVMPKEVNLDIH